MKTILLEGHKSISHAIQHIFLRHNYTMFPRRNEHMQLVYDIPTEEDQKPTPAFNKVFSDEEAQHLADLCLRYVYAPNLWEIMTTLIYSLPNQKRFHRATYLQPQVIASAFCHKAMKMVMQN